MRALDPPEEMRVKIDGVPPYPSEFVVSDPFTVRFLRDARSGSLIRIGGYECRLGAVRRRGSHYQATLTAERKLDSGLERRQCQECGGWFWTAPSETWCAHVGDYCAGCSGPSRKHLHFAGNPFPSIPRTELAYHGDHYDPAADYEPPDLSDF